MPFISIFSSNILVMNIDLSGTVIILVLLSSLLLLLFFLMDSQTMGMAVMLDVITNYVRSLQNQIEVSSD